MIPESLTLKTLAILSGVLAGLTVLVRLGRLLEALETVQARLERIEDKLDRHIESHE